MKNKLFLIFLFLTTSIFAQKIESNNFVYSKKHDFATVSTQYFEVQFYDDNKDLAIFTAKQLELAHDELMRKMEYKTSHKIWVNVFPNSNDYLQFSQEFLPQLHKNISDLQIHRDFFNVYYNGNQNDYYKQLKTELARTLISQMFIGGVNKGIFHNSLVMYLPDWFLNGMSHYLGEGWNAKDESILGSIKGDPEFLANNSAKDLKTITLQKSIWHYLNLSFKKLKMGELIYLMRVTRSVDGGLISALGVSPSTLSGQWSSWFREIQKKNESIQNEYVNLTSKSQNLVSYSVFKNKIAYIVENKGIFSLSIHNLNSKSTQHNIFKGGYKTDEIVRKEENYPVAFSQNGKILAFVLPQKNYNTLYFLDLESSETQTIPLNPSLDQISSINWSPDNKTIVVSGSKSGKTNLYLLKLSSDQFQPISKDIYDEILPEFSKDGKEIYFSSNRSDSEKVDSNFFRNNWDLWAYSIETQKMTQLTFTPEVNEYQLFKQVQDQFYLSDESGKLQLFHFNKETKTNHFKTELANGISNWSVDSSYYWFLTYVEGKKQLVQMKPEKVTQSINLPVFNWNYTIYTQFKEIQALKKRQIEFIDSIKNIVKDTISVDSTNDNGTIRYYVFDGARFVTVQKKREKKKNKYKRSDEKKLVEIFEIKKVKVNPSNPVSWFPILKETSFFLELDPLFRSRLKMALGFSDVYNNNNFQLIFKPYFDLKSSDIAINYLNQKHKLNWGMELEKNARFFKQPDRFKYNAIQIAPYIALKLNKFTQLTLRNNYSFLETKDMILYDQPGPDKNQQVNALSVQIKHKTVIYREFYPVKGHEIKFKAMQASNVQKGLQSKFVNFELEAKKYIKVGRESVLALRLNGGFSLGNDRPLYFIGGVDNWVNANFLNKHEIPIYANPINLQFMNIKTNLRGFKYNARNGYQFGVFNAELRMPIARILKHRLSSNAPYNLRWLINYDLGTAWKTGNPLSQKNPIDAVTINRPPIIVSVQSLKSPFIQSFGGTGLQFYVLGYNTRLDLSWTIEESTVSKPFVQISIGHDL